MRMSAQTLTVSCSFIIFRSVSEPPGGVDTAAADPEVSSLLAAVPEFAPRYLELVEQADGHVGAAVAFEELADFAADLAVQVEAFRPVLERIMAGVEAVAISSPDAEEIVGWSFLESLCPDDVVRLRPAMGPRTRAIFDSMEIPLD
jgi:hypothetical protein